MIDYSPIDRSSILRYLFYPREEFTYCPENGFDHPVLVEQGVSIVCRFYLGRTGWPWILFFHGNGEVVSDYDGIAPLYHQRKLNLVVADYRGYGASDGVPTLSHLVEDAHRIFEEVRTQLASRHLGEKLWVMGRSLGSISALELGCEHGETIQGLIIESGFPSVIRLITHLKIPASGIDLEAFDRACVESLKTIRIPILIIHGEEDRLVPVQEARDLYRYLEMAEKELVIIPSATHNDILFVGYSDYFKAIEHFVAKTARVEQP